MNQNLKTPVLRTARLKAIKNPDWVAAHLAKKEPAKTPKKEGKITVLMPEETHGYIRPKDHDCL